MSAGIEMDATGLTARLDAGAAAAADLMDAWPEVAKVWAARQQTVFAQRKGWAPLAPATLRRNRRGAPLVRTGALLAEATDPIPVRANPHYCVLGIGAPEVRRYAQWHQRGAGVPKRQPVPKLTPTERKALIAPIGEAIAKALKAA